MLIINPDGTRSRQLKEACAHCGSWEACDQCAMWTQWGIMACGVCGMPNAVFNKHGAYTSLFLCTWCGWDERS